MACTKQICVTEMNSMNASISHAAKRRAKRVRKCAKEAIFQSACERGDIIVVEQMLAEGVDPSYKNNKAIKCAERHGHLVIMSRIIRDIRVDSVATQDLILRHACRMGYVDVVDDILRKLILAPLQESFIRYALSVACEHGHLQVVERLLQDERVDPTADQNNALQRACEYGYFGIVDRLLQDPRVNPADAGNMAIVYACIGGNLDIVDRLLLDPRVNPADNCALLQACCGGTTDTVVHIVHRLLQDGRVNPTENRNILVSACESGKTDVVQRLLMDPRMVDMTQNSIETLWIACYAAHCWSRNNVVNLLLHFMKWFEPPNDRHFHKMKYPFISTFGYNSEYFMCARAYCLSRDESYSCLYENARKKWYAERAEQFGELHTELVATVASRA